MIATSTQANPRMLRALRTASPATGRVLTAYLDTSPTRAEKEAFVLALRDGCKLIRPSLGQDDAEQFEQAVRQAERFLTSEFQPGRPGLALFASGAPDYFFAMTLPRRPADEVAWGDRPLLGPLDDILADTQRIAVVLFDKERARILTVHLGEIEETREIEDYIPGKQATGDWFALAQTRFARHRENYLLRHAQHTIRELVSLLHARPFDHLLIGGPDEALAVLRHQLPRSLRARLTGTVSLELFAPDAAVLHAALEAAERIERNAEKADVEELLDAATMPHVTLGLRATLDALNQGRVHRLFIANSFVAEGGACASCGRITAGPGACPICGTPTVQLGDLRERVVELAERQGARVEVVSGEAAMLLAAHNWIGAWTRY